MKKSFFFLNLSIYIYISIYKPFSQKLSYTTDNTVKESISQQSGYNYQTIPLISFEFGSEPTNNVPPKASGRKIDGSIVLEVALKKDVVIICDVTAYPVPKFR